MWNVRLHLCRDAAVVATVVSASYHAEWCQTCVEQTMQLMLGLGWTYQYPSEPRSDPRAGGRRELIWEFLEIDGNITIRAQIPQIWEVKKALCLCGWVLDSCFPVCSLPNKWVALRPERTQPWERHAQARSDGYYAPPGFTSRYPEPSKRYHRRPGSDYITWGALNTHATQTSFGFWHVSARWSHMSHEPHALYLDLEPSQNWLISRLTWFWVVEILKLSK
jgi:hypothetical protein